MDLILCQHEIHCVIPLNEYIIYMALVNVSSDLTLSWDYQICILKNFRVEGACQSPPSCESPCPDDSTATQKFLVNVVACNVEDVCEKLRNSGFVRTIKSISVFNQPVFNRNPPLDPNAGPNCLTDVTPNPDDCSFCCDFLVDFTGEESVGGIAKMMTAYYHQMDGSMSVGSSTSSNLRIIRDAKADMMITGNFNVISSHYYHNTDGHMTMTSEADYLSSYYVNQAIGEMILSSGTVYKSSRYLATTVGTMNILGGSDYGIGLPYSMNGLMHINSQSNYQSSFNYYSEAFGSMSLSGRFGVRSSHYIHDMGGMLNINDQSNIGRSFMDHTMSGAMRLLDRMGLVFHAGSMDGSITVSNNSVSTWGASHSTGISLKINDYSNAQSSRRIHSAGGLMRVLDSTYSRSSNLGIIDLVSGVTDEAIQTGVTFSTIAADAITVVVPSILITDCCSVPISAVLSLKHNLLDLLALENFILRNGLTMPGDIDNDNSGLIDLQYRPRLGIWQGNVHFDGLSAVTSGRESWDFVFEYGCTDEAGGVQLSAKVWMFSLLIRIRNYVTSKIYLVRLLTFFDKVTVCPSGRPFDRFDFNFNFRNKTSIPTNIGNPVFYDEAGLFNSSPSFSTSQDLKFRLSATGSPLKQTVRVDLHEQADAASHVADDSGHPL